MTLEEHISKAEEDAKMAEFDTEWGMGNYFLDRTEALEYAKECRNLANWLKDYKRLLEQEPCEDCRYKEPEIIRCKDCREFRRYIDTDITFCDRTEVEVKDDDFCSHAKKDGKRGRGMTEKEAAKHLLTYSTTMGSGQTTDAQHNEAKRIAIKALEREACGDCISRENTLKAMIEQLGIRNEDYLLPAEATLYKVVKNMPPVTPQPKTGRWKKMVSVYDMIEGKYRMIPYTYKDEELDNPPFYVCDCGNNSKKPTHYCPDCGAKMEG